jgi:hypothetical protein
LNSLKDYMYIIIIIKFCSVLKFRNMYTKTLARRLKMSQSFFSIKRFILG